MSAVTNCRIVVENARFIVRQKISQNMIFLLSGNGAYDKHFLLIIFILEEIPFAVVSNLE